MRIDTGPDGHLTLSGVSTAALADHYGTPLYAYCADTMRTRYRAFEAALDDRRHRICYAMKANMNLSVLALFAELGAGFDVVSGGELERALRAGASGNDIVFSGVGKSAAELEAALRTGVRCFNVESLGELDRLAAIATSCDRVAPIALRVNPDVDPQTHPYISTGLRENKFGLPMAEAEAAYRRAADHPHLEVTGVDCHIGSQLTDLAPLREAFERIAGLVERLRGQGIGIEHIDVGGGIGVRYEDETPPSIDSYAALVRSIFADAAIELVFEPGRHLVADAGVLITRVEYIKQNEARAFAIVDAAMNDLLRPALYSAFHALHVDPLGSAGQRLDGRFDVVGPVCESGDFLARDRHLRLAPEDLIVVSQAGAYAFSMSSNYNARNRAAEVMIDAGEHWLIRRRETILDQIAAELPPRWPA